MKEKKTLLKNFYIIKRSIKAFIYGLLFYGCRIFPIQRNKIVFWTFEGSRGYCCNPKYIAEELIKRNVHKNENWKLIWLVDDIKEEFPEHIKKVKNNIWNRVFQLSTARFWIGNTRTLYGTKKRKNQIYIQTWHGTICIKPIGKYRGELFPRIAYLVSKADSKLTDYVLSGSDWCDMHYKEGLIYDGTILRTGTPRCDILINRKAEMRTVVRTALKIPEDSNILLYAPTFRGGNQNTRRSIVQEEITINFSKLTATLEKRFGGQWFIFIRLHPQLAARHEYSHTVKKSERVLDVTYYPDMNELIAAADAFMTDYSSSIFEAALLEMPCFIYANDLDDYIKSRGNLFFTMDQLPFQYAQNTEQLYENIKYFCAEVYKKNVMNFMRKQGIEEDGHASERVVNLIKKFNDE